MTTFHLLFTKKTERNVGADKIQTQLSIMPARAQANMARFGFSLHDTRFSQVGQTGSYQFDVAFVLRYSGMGDPNSKLGGIVEDMKAAGHPYGWEFARSFEDQGSGTVVTQQEVAPEIEDGSDIELGDASRFFSHLYERNAQISVILSAVEAARATNFEHRFHCVLFGNPGSAKTAITQGIADMVGPTSVLKFDGPSCTKAGLENFFLNAEDDITGPKIMIFEEIEKADPEIHKILLGVLDTRGEIRKTTGNEGQRTVGVKVVCLATVNNIQLFDKSQAGSLASRFTHKVYCPKPSRRALTSILEREVDSVKGNRLWVQPALDYTIGVEGSHDPRRAIAVCLSGRDKLLTGSYQKALRQINPK